MIRKPAENFSMKAISGLELEEISFKLRAFFMNVLAIFSRVRVKSSACGENNYKRQAFFSMGREKFSDAGVNNSRGWSK
jgi:hypothetical protein